MYVRHWPTLWSAFSQWTRRLVCLLQTLITRSNHCRAAKVKDASVPPCYSVITRWQSSSSRFPRDCGWPVRVHSEASGVVCKGILLYIPENTPDLSYCQCLCLYNSGLVMCCISKHLLHCDLLLFSKPGWINHSPQTGLRQTRTGQSDQSAVFTKASCQVALIRLPLPDSCKEKGVCAQSKEQTVGWLLNNTKNTSNPGFWHTESSGEHWGVRID